MYHWASDSEEDEAVPAERQYRVRRDYEFDDFHERFRLTRGLAEQLLNVIGPDLASATLRSQSLEPKQKLLCALRFYATGAFLWQVQDSQGPSKTSVHRAVHLVTHTIVRRLFQHVVRFPEDVQTVAGRFYQYAGMPAVAGCIDGTLIRIKAPSQNEPQFVDRHGDHSINAMFVCGPNLRFYDASVRWPGSVHDARVLCTSTLAGRMEAGWRPFPNAVLLGDSGYPLTNWLQTPIPDRANLPENQLRFNRAHKRTRRLIECAFGIFKNSFCCLSRLRLKRVDMCCEVIKACAVLHNLRTKDRNVDVPDDTDDDDDGVELDAFGLEREADTDDDTKQQGQPRTAGLARRNELVRFFT